MSLVKQDGLLLSTFSSCLTNLLVHSHFRSSRIPKKTAFGDNSMMFLRVRSDTCQSASQQCQSTEGTQAALAASSSIDPPTDS